MKMKLYKPAHRKEDINNLINKILLIIIGILIGIIIIGTLGGLISKKARPGKNLRTVDPSPTEIESLNKNRDTQIAAYTGIETLRIVTAADATNPDDHGSTLILSPWFSYPESNTEFFEELSKKRGLLTGIITSYFSTKTKETLLMTSEDDIKSSILEEINNQMTLGKLEQLYFTDYLFLD